MPTPQIRTESEPSFLIAVSPMTEIQVFNFVREMYAHDTDADWYITITDVRGERHSGLLRGVENETVLLTQDFSVLAQITPVSREEATLVRIWRVL